MLAYVHKTHRAYRWWTRQELEQSEELFVPANLLHLLLPLLAGDIPAIPLKLFPATVLACMLCRELYPVRLTRRVNDEVTFTSPVWRVPVAPEVAGKVVAVVDEIADTGETLALVRDAVRERGAARVIPACLASHSWADPAPDISALVSDELIPFPWDQQVLIGGRWQAHSEIEAALAAQHTSTQDDRV
jgi:phosphoribosylpyrophosphate synthetase